MKRGTDHNWEVCRYRGDVAWYAHCGCGYYYRCSDNKRKEDGSWSFEQYIARLHNYCPFCGARKLRYNKEPIESEEFAPWARKN